MYYDRRIDDTLAEALTPGGPLAWLMSHVRSATGRARHAHLQFRQAPRGPRRLGSVQLYWGRTSPLELQLRRGECVRLAANRTYRDLSPALFAKPLALADLACHEAAMVDHLDAADRLLSGTVKRRRALREGEATCHAGLMWRYGHRFSPGDPIVAVDAEARIGFSSRAEQSAADDALRIRLGLHEAEALPKKLDTVAVSAQGDLVLVEVKDADGSIDRAVKQVAAHVVRFSQLMSEGLAATVQGMLAQKRMAGLIPDGPSVNTAPRIVPWIAAPDSDAAWASAWRAAIAPHRQNLSPYLAGLRLVRLSPDGEILEEVAA